jgi:hypothetical protein
MHSTFGLCYVSVMAGMRALIRTRLSGGLLAAGVACLLAFQAVIASIGLGMSAAWSLGPEFEICTAVVADNLDAPARKNDTGRSGHLPQCPFCFVAAQSAGHPAVIGDEKVFRAFAGRDVSASPFATAEDSAFAGRLHRTTGDPRGPPPFSV